jgi:hypothetical protein
MSTLNCNQQVPSAPTPGLEPSPQAQSAAPSKRQEHRAIKALTDWTPADFMKAMPALKGLEPADGQQELPVLLQKVGENVKFFFEAFPGVVSHEEITLEQSDESGAVSDRDIQEFSYRVLSRPGKNETGLEEYRTDTEGERVEPEPLLDGFVTGSFTSRLVHFHPLYQSDSSFRYLGLQLVDGRETYVVFFAQVPGKARVQESLRTKDESIPTLVQGLAWIDPVSFRILRLRTDMQQPERDIGLLKETTEVLYSEVSFRQGGKTLWLPREATVTGQLDHSNFHNQHRYSDYWLFNTQTNEKPKGP